MTSDCHLEWYGDLVIGASGDLQTAAGPTLLRQRVLRRLLTNPGDYIWNMRYGAGLARFVGQARSDASIVAVVREQLRYEAISLTPPSPGVSVLRNVRDDPSAVYLNIEYYTPETQSVQNIVAKLEG